MRLAIIGYGKMGKTVAEIAPQRGHEISLVIDPVSGEKIESLAERQIDAAIEFSTPKAAPDNIMKCFSFGIPVVCGTTGWHDNMDVVKAACKAKHASLIYAANFSIGVQLFRHLTRWLAETMNQYPDYEPHIEEVHHVHKKDSPSGTAIRLANDLLGISSSKDHWVEDTTKDKAALSVLSDRRGEVAGIHSIVWDGADDQIVIQHSAKNRMGFARGAIIAAEWIGGRTGIYTISDMLNS